MNPVCSSRPTTCLARLLRFSAIVFLSAHVALPSPQAPQMSAAEHLAADTQRATPAGATFTAPGGWSLRSGASLIVLDAPEQGSHVAIADVHAADAPAAVTAAWAAYRPGAKRPLKLATPRPARNGWEERRVFD